MHSLHHKSYNPGPWSGLSMHPVEHLLYYGCMMVPALWIPQHPFAVLYNRVHLVTTPPPGRCASRVVRGALAATDCRMRQDFSPLPGHDGYDQPGGGSHYHYLHHSKFNCNYGTPMMPMDKLLGYYDDGTGSAQEKAAKARRAKSS